MCKPHTQYVEPYAGSLAVLFAKPYEGIAEIVNDKNDRLTNFWQVLQGEKTFEPFKRLCDATPFSEKEWNKAKLAYEQHTAEDKVVQAWQFFIQCRQSMAGRMTSFAPISTTRLRRRMNEQVSAWLTAIEGLPAVHARLKRVLILNRHAPDVIRQFDSANTLHYLDPPYPHTTRTTTREYGDFEMTEADHIELLKTITGGSLLGKIILSSYDNPLYSEYLKSWGRHSHDLPNNASSKKEKDRKQEVLWTNF